jgi:anaerobic selenocysteine-containing dehydrogenase
MYADIILPEAGFLERMGVSDVYTFSPEIALRDRAIEPLHESKPPYEIMISLSEALAGKGDPDVASSDFKECFEDEEAFINEILSEAPGLYNIGSPLPYPDLPEECLILGTPDNPSAFWGSTKIRNGEPVTVEWLRRNQGVAVWPASYYRYKMASSAPSGICPRTPSHRFEFQFNYTRDINKAFGTALPETFYWNECRWNPKTPDFAHQTREYPFQLVSGRVHHAMTMTSVCPYLAETETECMKPYNDAFPLTMPDISDELNRSGLAGNTENIIRENSISIPVFAFNRSDGEKMQINNRDLVILENPLGMKIRGKAFLTEEIMPGVIKTAFGPGGQRASGIGIMRHTAAYTAAINNLHDPDNLSPFTGMPGFGDILVKVTKEPR